MKRIALAVALTMVAGTAALAADLPPPPAPPPRAPATYVPAPVPYYNWTGLYVGGNVGGVWQSGSYSDQFADTFNATGSSIKFFGGGQVGINYEFAGGFLLGAEADFDFLPNNNNTSNTVTLAGGALRGLPASVTINNSWLILLDARVGYAWDRFLVYGKGGGAWVNSSNPTINVAGITGTLSTSQSNFGWTVGAGVEYAFWGNFSARVEYDYVGLSSASFSQGGYNFTGSSRNLQMVDLGINYKFGFGY
jgi:outer membrane immunogenic protein